MLLQGANTMKSLLEAIKILACIGIMLYMEYSIVMEMAR
jgi:hypothetical protein